MREKGALKQNKVRINSKKAETEVRETCTGMGVTNAKSERQRLLGDSGNTKLQTFRRLASVKQVKTEQ